MGAGGGIVLAAGYRIASIRAGEITPDWAVASNPHPPYNQWHYAIGVGAVTTVVLYVSYFALRILAN